MADADLDPKAFLQTVRDLSDKRQREDNERYEKLEADIISDRNARLARRLGMYTSGRRHSTAEETLMTAKERERSLSPEKRPRSIHSSDAPSSRNATPPPPAHRSSARDLSRESPSRSRSSTPVPESESRVLTESVPAPSRASPSSAMPSRSNTMSWQKRPASGIRSRPLSLLAGGSDSSRTPQIEKPTETAHDTPSRQDIAQALGQKDPSWFKQTADRGLGSAAYRKSPGITDSELGSQRRALPGMTRDDEAQTPREMSPAPSSTQIASRPGSSGVELASVNEGEQPALSRDVPSFNRPRFERPASPTKGMGGFVQSAMMKRTDSVSKRWSAQPSGGLSRQDSTASIRSGIGSVRDGLAGSRSMPKLDPRLSNEPDSRPTSSHSTVSNLTLQEGATRDSFAQSSASLHSRSKSIASLREPPSIPEDVQGPFSPPLSPSKRWSPSKSSWLESALARPESPKPSPAQQNQPSWMADLNKAKQQRNSAESTFSQGDEKVEIGTAAVKSFKQVSPQESSFGNRLVKPAQASAGAASDRAARVISPPTKAKPSFLTESAKTESPAAEPYKNAFSDTSESQPDMSKTRSPADSIKSPPMITSPKKPSTITPRSKPVTPPKKDFRSNLKPRQEVSDGPGTSEPEFKNVFGNLKKTATEKYVAPDLLKDNITRGKAGLATTNGPQKTERRDELKESLLKKKEEMKAKAGEGESEPTRRVAQVPQAPTPEALMKKKSLGRSDSLQHLSTPDSARRNITPEALARHRTLKGKPEPPKTEKPNVTVEKAVSPAKPATSDQRASMTNASGLGISNGESGLSNGKARTENKEGPSSKIADKSVNEADSTNALAKTTSNKLADRFNPALASILSRGPPVSSSKDPATSASNASATAVSGAAPRRSDKAEAEGNGGKQLTHMTKSRAKGPKRRKPNAKETSNADKPVKQIILTDAVQPATASGDSSPITPLQPRPKSAAVRAISLDLSTKSVEKEKSTTPVKSATWSLKMNESPDTKPTVATRPKSTIADPAPSSRKPSSNIRQLPSTPTTAAPEANSTTAEAKPALTNNMSASEALEENKENSDGLPSVKNAAAKWGRPVSQTASAQRNLPVKLPSKQDEEAAMKSAGLLSTSPLRFSTAPKFGLELPSDRVNGTGSQRSPSTPNGPLRPMKSSRTVSSTLKELPSARDATKRPEAPSTEAGRLVFSYFGSTPVSDAGLEIDAQAVLATRPDDASKIKTLRKSIQEISSDGKLTPLPAQEEHILFDTSMYIGTHVFGSVGGSRVSEVYLWAGSGVSESAIEDAQLFGKRVAKEAASGQRTVPAVTVVRQTREPATFFQALGGILIVRKGSRADSATKPYMLCGRSHLGNVAFDEVNLSLGSLCSAYPYIIVQPTSLQEKRVYLWKGKGCGPEALGSARLISMDLDASGSIVEIDEGTEPPADFLSIFTSDSTKQIPEPIPNLVAPVSETNSPRLFRIDASEPRRSSSSFLWATNLLGRSRAPASRPTSSSSALSPSDASPTATPKIEATELSPFGQSDLEPEHVYVLDTLNGVYVLPGPLLNTTPHWQIAFAQACMFANEYAALSANGASGNSNGDSKTASVPRIEVCFGTLPRTGKMVFRAWDDRRGLWGTGGMMAGKASELEGVVGVRDVLDVVVPTGSGKSSSIVNRS